MINIFQTVIKLFFKPLSKYVFHKLNARDVFPDANTTQSGYLFQNNA